jgi:hypothetical protein
MDIVKAVSLWLVTEMPAPNGMNGGSGYQGGASGGTSIGRHGFDSIGAVTPQSLSLRHREEIRVRAQQVGIIVSSLTRH